MYRKRKLLFTLIGLMYLSSNFNSLAMANPKNRLSLELEAGPAWASRNDVRSPGNSGTKFDISDFDSGPFATYRAYLNFFVSERHQIRALVAPLSLSTSTSLNSPIQFEEQNFVAGNPLDARYKFNSYRLGYIYHFKPKGIWSFRLGFINKIRDAEISLRNDSVTAVKSNVGYVPLLNFGARANLSKKLYLDLDADALAAPQGRAEDVAIRMGYRLPKGWDFRLGYRMIEGGADNDEVYTFAWFHYLTFGLQYEVEL